MSQTEVGGIAVLVDSAASRDARAGGVAVLVDSAIPHDICAGGVVVLVDAQTQLRVTQVVAEVLIAPVEESIPPAVYQGLVITAAGVESTPGSPAVTTQVLYGNTLYTDELERRWYVRSTGLNVLETGSFLDIHRLGRWTFNSQAEGIGYEELPLFLSSGVEGVSQGTASGDIYVWTYTGSLMASPCLKTLTLKKWSAENTSALETTYGVTNSWTLTGGGGTLVTFEAEIFSRSGSYTTVKDPVSPSTQIVTLAGGMARLYLADSWSGLDTAASQRGLLHDYTLTFKAGLRPEYLADGTLEFYRYRVSEPVFLELSGIYEWNDYGASKWLDFRNSPTKFVRLCISDGASRYFQVDMAVGYMKVTPWSGEKDQDAVGDFTMRSKLDMTSGSHFRIKVGALRAYL